MHIAYWIVVGLLGMLYLYAGGKKVVQSREQLAPLMQWVDTIAHVGGAVHRCRGDPRRGRPGPAPMTGIAPVLALLAAIGFVVLQIQAWRLTLNVEPQTPASAVTA